MRARVFIALFALVGCNAADSLVGGHCKAGFVESEGECRESTAAPSASSSSSPSSNGFGSGSPTMPSEEPSSQLSPSTSSSSGAPSSSSGGASSSSGGSSSSSSSSGAAPNAPDASAPAPLVCDGALVACHGECIPVTNDAANCGACGKICPSNLCVEGECQGALAGDVIVLGKDSSSPNAKMITNALSIATTDPIRVLAFDGGDPKATADRPTVKFRKVAYTTATADDLEATDLAKRFDVVLVQNAGPAASYLGARTHAAMETFTTKGGIVVAVDDGASDMPAYLRDSGLLAMEGHTMLAADVQIVVSAPNDALGMQVLSPYASSSATVGFVGVTNAADVTVVARTNDANAYPTALHRFVR